MEDPAIKLKFRIIESSSEDPDYPLYEVMRGADSSGWLSVRFCSYPQEILVQFIQPVRLRQINLLINEKKIPSLIEFYTFYPATADDYFTNYKHLTYDKIGYIRMDTNSRTNYKAREYRKVYVDVNCLYLKFVLHKNYVNKYNAFNQVGLITFDFLGYSIYSKAEKLNFYLKESIKPKDIGEEEMDETSREKLKICREQLDEALKIEDYDEAKHVKKIIDRIKFIGKKIYELEVQKKISVNNEDFDNAKLLKLEIDRLKQSLQQIDKSQGVIVPYQNVSIELNKSREMEENAAKDNKDNIKEGKDNMTANTFLNPNDM